MSKALKVKKKDGQVENFDPEKIKRAMEKASIDAGYLLEGNVDLTLVDVVIKDLDKELQGKEEVESVAIREKILNKLEQIDSRMVKAWKKFEKRYKLK